MIFETVLNRIKEKVSSSDKGNWINERLIEIETHKLNFDSLPFKIIELKDSGFLAKVKGLYAFISFYHMPWKYYGTDSWIAIAPSLIGKKFFCKIHKISKDPTAIILNGEIPQFKKAELTIGEEYKGLIIKISEYGVFIDIGHHFDWKSDSLTGLLHKSQLADNERIEDFKQGQEIITVYEGVNDNGQLVFCNDRDKIDWQLGKPQELVGQTIWAKIIRKPDNKTVYLLVREKYKATLTIDKQAYAPKYRKKLNRPKTS